MTGRLGLSAIVSAGQATAVNVRIFYRRTDIDADLTRIVIPLPATDSTPITVDLVTCLADPINATRGACPIQAELILVRGSVELDRAMLGPIDVRPGENALFPAATLYEVATVQIGPPAGGALAIEPETTFALAVVAKDKTGAIVTGGTTTWGSASPGIATINANSGFLTTVAPGVAVITANVGGRSGQISIQVVPFTVRRVVVSPRTATVTVGKTVPIAFTAFDRKDRQLSGRTAVWTSSNAAVASVSSAGTVTGVAAGSAAIVATVNGVSDTAVVTVTPPAVASVSVTLARSALTVGQSTQATATPMDDSGTVLSGRVVSAWRSNNSAVATVNASGVVTAVGIGSATITATIDGVDGSAGVSVSSAPPASVLVNLVPTVGVGQTVTATATVRDVNNVVIPNAPVVWTTSNSGIATVSSSGVVAGVAPGNVTIIASIAGVTGSATLSVVAQPSTFSLSITGSGTGSGTVTSNAGGINCVITAGSASGTCGATYPSGTAVTLSATAQGQSVFAGMTNAACTANTCSVVMTQARNVVATFTATGSFLLTVDSESDFGTVTSNPAGIDCASSTIGHICTFSFATGTSVQLTAKPATGYNLRSWSGDCTGSALTCTVLMTQARSVTAFFGQNFAPTLSGFSATLVGVASPSCSNGGTLYQVKTNYSDASGTVAMNTSSVSLSWQGSPITTWTDSWSGTAFSGTVTFNACVLFGAATSGTFIIQVRNVSPPPSYNLISGSVSKPSGAP